jgi:hypothetical protein
MCAVTGLVAVVVMATAILGLIYSARTQAALASDAAALAAAVATYPGAGRGPPGAEATRAAAANGAVVTRCACRVDASLAARVASVTAVVVVDAPLFGALRVGATSRAEFDPKTWLGW